MKIGEHDGGRGDGEEKDEDPGENAIHSVPPDGSRMDPANNGLRPFGVASEPRNEP